MHVRATTLEAEKDGRAFGTKNACFYGVASGSGASINGEKKVCRGA
jgi:hypothetical protein